MSLFTDKVSNPAFKKHACAPTLPSCLPRLTELLANILSATVVSLLHCTQAVTESLHYICWVTGKSTMLTTAMLMIMKLKEHTMTFGPISTISRVTLAPVMTGSLEMVVGSAVSPVFVPSIYAFLTESLQIFRNSDIKYEIYYNHYKLAHILSHTTITDESYSLYGLHKSRFSDC